jgi:hypothetical protein
MSFRARIAFVMLWVVSLVAVGVVVTAQSRSNQDGQVLTGSDIGFRVQAPTMDGKAVTGTWVVRMNGQWMDTRGALAAHPVTRLDPQVVPLTR